ncbi:MAG: hypothetical protein AM326_00120 [Candidatus Thorarchaeota archaeon SMTZ-45]|nr:MAG: hypothetical protein AM326_00120 [Candidatus Thorarchaeota archaeon SMTZ-45]
MKILFIEVGQFTNKIKSYMKTFRKFGHEVEASIFSRNTHSTQSLILKFVKLVRHSRHKKFDIIYSRNPPYTGLLAKCISKLCQSIVVYECLDDWYAQCDLLWFDSGLYKTFKVPLLKLVKFLQVINSKNTDLFITVNEIINKQMMERFKLPKNKTFIVRNLPFEIPQELDSIELTHPSLLFLGTIRPYLGLDVIVNALSYAKKEIETITLYIVGGTIKDTGYLKEIIELSKKRNVEENIVITGRLPWITALSYVKSADICLNLFSDYPKYRDTDSLKSFEYMMLGKAIISADLPGPRLIFRNGENAFLVPPDDPYALSKAIIKLSKDSNLRNTLGRQARMDYLEKYNWEQTVTKLINTFGRLLMNKLRSNKRILKKS